MAGLFPGICNTQSVDQNGQPQANAVLSVFNSGTTQLSAVFQDIGLAIGGQNPMKADLTGRLPIFYVADGVYAVRLVDQNGVQIYFYPQVASIGASSTGGGGAAVDPTTIAQTGDEIFRKLGASGPRTGWLIQNGTTFGNAGSGSSQRSNVDTQALYALGWAASWVVLGGRGLSAAADFAAGKPITLPSMQGRGAIGKDGMGTALANVLPGANVIGGNADVDGALGGEANHLLGNGEMPTHNHGGITGNDNPDHTHGVAIPPGIATFGAGGFPGAAQPGNTQTAGASVRHQHAVANDGGGGAHNNMIPFSLGTWYIKL